MLLHLMRLGEPFPQETVGQQPALVVHESCWSDIGQYYDFASHPHSATLIVQKYMECEQHCHKARLSPY